MQSDEVPGGPGDPEWEAQWWRMGQQPYNGLPRRHALEAEYIALYGEVKGPEAYREARAEIEVRDVQWYANHLRTTEEEALVEWRAARIQFRLPV